LNDKLDIAQAAALLVEEENAKRNHKLKQQKDRIKELELKIKKSEKQEKSTNEARFFQSTSKQETKINTKMENKKDA
jgi:hypothetical protein